MTNPIIYWKEYDEPKTWFDPILKTEMKSTGQYVCDNEKVERVWITVGHPPTDMGNEFLRYWIHFVLEDGTRHDIQSKDFPKNDPNGHDLDPLFAEAEQYLKELK